MKKKRIYLFFSFVNYFFCQPISYNIKCTAFHTKPSFLGNCFDRFIYDFYQYVVTFDCKYLINHFLCRYPYDPYDRIWQRYDNGPAWTNVTISQTVQTSNITNFDVPSLIMQSAATPLNSTRIDFSWSSSDPSINDGNMTYLLLLYFAELQQLPSNALRQFDILVDNATWNGSQHYTPKFLSAEAVSRLVHGSGQHSVSLVATPSATLPPILNAFEIYSVQQLTGFTTKIGDGTSIFFPEVSLFFILQFSFLCFR